MLPKHRFQIVFVFSNKYYCLNWITVIYKLKENFMLCILDYFPKERKFTFFVWVCPSVCVSICLSVGKFSPWSPGWLGLCSSPHSSIPSVGHHVWLENEAWSPVSLTFIKTKDNFCKCTYMLRTNSYVVLTSDTQLSDSYSHDGYLMKSTSHWT